MQSTTLALVKWTDAEVHMVEIAEVPYGESASRFENLHAERSVVMLNITLPHVAAARVWNALRVCIQNMKRNEIFNPPHWSEWVFMEGPAQGVFIHCYRSLCVSTVEESDSTSEDRDARGGYGNDSSSDEELSEMPTRVYACKASTGVDLRSRQARLSTCRASHIHEEMLRLIASDSELRDADASLAEALRRRCGVSVSEGSNWLYPSNCEIESSRCECCVSASSDDTWSE